MYSLVMMLCGLLLCFVSVTIATFPPYSTYGQSRTPFFSSFRQQFNPGFTSFRSQQPFFNSGSFMSARYPGMTSAGIIPSSRSFLATINPSTTSGRISVTPVVGAPITTTTVSYYVLPSNPSSFSFGSSLGIPTARFGPFISSGSASAFGTGINNGFTGFQTTSSMPSYSSFNPYPMNTGFSGISGFGGRMPVGMSNTFSSGYNNMYPQYTSPGNHHYKKKMRIGAF